MSTDKLELDTSQRFLFDATDVRGEIVRCTTSFEDMLSNHDYPEVAKNLLGEFVSAAVLLSTTMKFDGHLSLQANSRGEVPFIMAECDSDRQVRGIVKPRDSYISGSFQMLLSQGTLGITLHPKNGQPYQGIVPLQKENLAGCLADYFQQSEQLPTWFAFAVGEDKGRPTCAGMILQQMPPQNVTNEDTRVENWNRLTHLASTTTDTELLTIEFENLLLRLFNDEHARVFDPKFVQFRCGCNRERTAKAVLGLGREEAQSIIDEQGSITLNCQFCAAEFQFSQTDINDLFS